MGRWRGLRALVHDTVHLVTDLVEEGHESTARTTVRFASLAPPLSEPVRAVDRVRRAVTRGVLGVTRAANRVVQSATDAALDLVPDASPPEVPVPLRSDVVGAPGWVADALLGGVNGVVGDHLARSRNGLDLGLSLRLGDDPVAKEAALRGGVSGRVAVFVHGLATTEWSWSYNAERWLGDPDVHFGTLLARDLGFTPVFVRYNTGRHVSENGRDLAEALEALIVAWPQPVEDLVLVGHSMGGLVSRSACLAAEQAGSGWIRTLHRVVCLGTPHLGAPLERFGHGVAAVLGSIDLPGTRIVAALIQGRSDGIKDLRHGHVSEGAWRGRDLDALAGQGVEDVPLVQGVDYLFVAGSLTRDPAHPLSVLAGDLLVPVRSAAGTGVVGDARARRVLVPGVRHHELQVHPQVYQEIRHFIESTGPLRPGSQSADGLPAEPGGGLGTVGDSGA